MTEALIKDSLIRLSTATQARSQYENAGSGQCEAALGRQSENGTSHAATQADQLVREIDALDALLAKERRSLHPQLVHFLANRSYAKALAFLGGENGEIPDSARRKVNEENT